VELVQAAISQKNEMFSCPNEIEAELVTAIPINTAPFFKVK
jgi:hypothetical protein